MKSLFKSIFPLFSLFALAIAPRIARGAEDWTNRLPSIAVGTYAEIPVTAGKTLKVRLALPDGGDALSFRAPGGASLLGIRRYAGRLCLYADGRPFADIEDKWDAPVSLRLPVDTVPAEPEAEDYVQPLGFFTFEDAFMTADKSTALQNWSVCSGNWGLHAVTGLTVGGETLANKRGFPTPDRSPNFYSLNGGGAASVILAGETFQSHYAVRASVQHAAGTNGIVFLATEVPDEEEGDSLTAYSFTVTTDPTDGRLFFSLREGCVPGKTAGRFLAGAKTALTPGQWYLLEARLSTDQIVCLVDHRELLRVSRPLPPGGMYGLFADVPAEAPTYFDDFHAATWQGLSLTTLAEGDKGLFVAKGKDAPVRKGRFPFPDSSPFSYDVVGQKEHLRLSRGDSASRYYGTPSDLPARVDLAVDLPDDGGAELGLGLTERAGEPRYLLRLQRSGKACRLSCLANDASNGPAPVAETVLPADRYRFPMMLTLDATQPGLVSWRVDDDTFAVRATTNAPCGAAGFTLRCGSKGTLEASLPMISRVHSPYTDLFEKNKMYVVDPFMRHWASTEGQWLPYTNAIAWYKDDVFRRVSLEIPLVDGYSLDLDVPEGETNGTFRLVLTNGVLDVLERQKEGYGRLVASPYPPATMTGEGRTLSVTNRATVRLDGAVFLVRAGGETVCDVQAPLPHRGRRMRLALPYEKREFMRHLIVHREPVYDFLFTESLHDWVVNGGRWEIVNRFQCYPVWSHMDGENRDSLAALWAKYDFFGDFGLTFIAGMRHGWYERLGDLNVTLFNRRTTPSEGYSLVVSGWDPDKSQRWSRLFKNGELLAKSDAMAVPRYRDGNLRRGYEPMLAKGRDVHGAWYTINLRKLGKRLAFEFDHKPVLEVEDDKPLSLGGLGIWTYRNSMVVARVRVAAEAVRPRLVPSTPVETEPKWADPDGKAAPARSLVIDGQPVQMIREGQWHANDPIGYPEVSFEGKGEKTAMTVTSLHGSGAFLATPSFPSNIVRASSIAGWRLEVARSKGARFNFEYRLTKGKGRGIPYTHVICGADVTDGERRISGRCPEAPAATPDGKGKVWTPVTIWLPSFGKPLDDWQIEIEGFGNLEPGDLQQGLEGNGPGEWYAIRKMVPVFRGPPDVGSGTEELDDLSRALAKGKAKKVNETEVPAAIDADEPSLLWILPPSDSQGLLAKIRMEPTPLIRIESTLPWPNPLLAVSNVALDGVAVPDAVLEDNVLTIPLPRPLPRGDFSRKVSFTTLSGRPFAQILPARAFATKAPPVLVDVEFNPASRARYQNFESMTNRAASFQHQTAHSSIETGDPIQSAYLRIANRGGRNRLTSLLARDFDADRTPLLRLRYRGDEMAFVDFVARANAIYALALPPDLGAPPPPRKPKKEKGKRQQPRSIGRDGPEADAILDGAWHTADLEIGYAPCFGQNGDVFLQARHPLHTTSVDLARRRGRGNVDQTGCQSVLDLDEIAIGPALDGQALTNFAFRATYDAPNGLVKTEYAIVRDDGEGEPKPDWKEARFDEDGWTRPVADVLADGCYDLLLRAVDGNGGISKTTTVPFLVDTKPPAVSSATLPKDLQTTGAPWHIANQVKDGTYVVVKVDGDDGAPARLDGAELTSRGEKIKVAQPQSGFSFFHEDNVATLAINWPVALAKEIHDATNGASIDLVLANVTDGAGNRAADYKTSVKIDYAKDKKAPFFKQPPRFPYLRGMVEIIPHETFFTSLGKTVEMSLVEANAKTNITFKTYRTTAKEKEHRLETVFPKENPWKLEKNRWFLCKLRLPSSSIAKAKAEAPFILRFVLPLEKGKTQTVELPFPLSTNAVPASLRRPATLPADRFFDIALDVPAFLKGIVGEKLPETVKSVSLVLPGEKGFAIDIASLVIMDDWKKDASFTLRSFDESGLDGLYCEGQRVLAPKGPATFRLIPSELKRPAPEVYLPVYHVRDRAGNEAVKGFVFPCLPQ